MWFQRVTEVDEAEDDISESRVVEGTSMDLEQPRQLHLKVTGPVLGPADFQRVRMLRKITAVPLSNSDRTKSPRAVSLEEVNTASLISMPSKDVRKFDNRQESTMQDMGRASFSSPNGDSDNISPELGYLKHGRPQTIPTEEENTVPSTFMSSKDKLANGQESMIQNIARLSISSTEDNINDRHNSPEPGHPKHDRPQTITPESDTVSPIPMSSKGKLDNGQESTIQDLARLVTAGLKEKVHNYKITLKSSYTKQNHGESRLGHHHHGSQGHGSTSHRTRAPEYHWEWLWGCVRAPIAGLSVHTKKKCSVIVPSTLR
jgi:hypothetical protein